jgi:hypothetical protein
MKKADNFDASKWLVENKITTQSRLNEVEVPSNLNLTDESNWNILYGPGGRIFQISQIGPNIDRKNQIGLDIMVSERKNIVTIAGDPGNSAEFVKTIDKIFNPGASRINQFSNSGGLETFITLDQLDQLAPGLYERN